MSNDNMQSMIDRYKRELLELGRKNKTPTPSKKPPEKPMMPPMGGNPPQHAMPVVPPTAGNPPAPGMPPKPPMPPMGGQSPSNAMPPMTVSPPVIGRPPMQQPMAGNPMEPAKPFMPPPFMERQEPEEKEERQQPFMPYRGTDEEYYSGEHYIPFEEFYRRGSEEKNDRNSRPYRMPDEFRNFTEANEKSGMYEDYDMRPQNRIPGEHAAPAKPGEGFYDDYNTQHHSTKRQEPRMEPKPFGGAGFDNFNTEPFKGLPFNGNNKRGLGEEDDTYDDLQNPIMKIKPVVPYLPSRTGDEVQGDIPPLPPTAGSDADINLRRPQRQQEAPTGGEMPSQAPKQGTGNMPPNQPLGSRATPPAMPPAEVPDVLAESFTPWNEDPPLPSSTVNPTSGRVLQTATGTPGAAGPSASTQPGTGSQTPAGGRLFLNRQYTSIQEFNQVNPKKGTLKVQVFAGDRAFPIVGAKVTVFRDINGQNYTFYTKVTDISGIVTGLQLPAPDKNLSLKPSDIAPYSTFNVTVEHPKFVSAEFDNVPIFDGIESIQPARMIPKVEGTGAPQVKRTVEIQPHDL